MKLNATSLKIYNGPIYGFDIQPILGPMEGVVTLSIYVEIESSYRMALMNFPVAKISSALNVIIRRVPYIT